MQVLLHAESLVAFLLERMASVPKGVQCNWFQHASTAEEMGLDLNDIESEDVCIICHFAAGHKLEVQLSHAAYSRIKRDETPQQP